MADIVELITKLGFEVENKDSLKSVTDEFAKQVNAIDKLQGKLDMLKSKMKMTTDVNEQQKLSTAILRTQKAIDAQTQSAQKALSTSDTFQKAVANEIGIIQKLNDKLSDLKRTREKQTTKENINEINKEIELAKKELEDLLGEKKKEEREGGEEKPFGFGLVGDSIKDEAAGALSGLFQGLGLGAGLSIIPGLVNSLFDYSASLLDTRAAVEQAEEAVTSFNASLVTELNSVDGLNKSLNEAFGFGIVQYEKQIEAASALGVIEGKVFEDRKRRFDAEQSLRQAEADLLDQENEKYRKVSQALVQYDKVRNLGRLKETIADLGLSPAKLDKINQEIENFFKKINDLPINVRENVRKSIKLSENDQLVQFLADSSTAANVKYKEMEDAKIAFQEQTNREIYELSKKLNEDIASENDKFIQDDIGRKEKTAALIEQSYQNQGEAAVRALNIEVETARKAGILTTQIKSQFDAKFNLIVKENEAKKVEALRLFNVQQVQEQQKLNEQLLQGELLSLNQRLQLLTGTDLQANVDLRNAATNKELMLQRTANANKYDEQVRANEKQQQELIAAGKTETQEYQVLLDNLNSIFTEYNQKQSDAELLANTKRIDNIRKGYADAIEVITKESQNLNASINRTFSGEQLSISQGDGGLFGRRFQSRLSELSQSSAQERSNISQNVEAIIEAQQELELATRVGKVAKTPEEKKAAKDAIDAATTNINTLETKQNVSNKKIVDNEREALKLKVNAYANAYTEIANIAQNAYNQIAEYRQQDIQREISAREKQLSIGLELAKLGNTQVLDEQRNALKQARKEERQAALEQQAINGALQLSYALVAVAKAAAEGGGIGSIATVAAAIGALVTGYGLVRTASQSTQTPAFKDGVIDFDGKGTATSDSNVVRISRGESVMTANATAKFKDHLKLMQAGIDPYQSVMSNFNTEQVSRGEFMEIKKGLDNVVSAINNKQTSVETITTKDHISTMVKEQQRIDRRKYGQVRN